MSRVRNPWREHGWPTGIALPDRIGSHGWSSGGYPTRVALTRWPGLFAAGGSLARISPMTALERLTSPVLLAHGDRDTTVPVSESVRAHQALTALARRASFSCFRVKGTRSWGGSTSSN